MQALLFELIQVAIGHRNELSRVPKAAEWKALFSIAEKQTILGVCFAGVKRLPAGQVVTIPMSLKMQWLAVTAQIQQRNEVINRRCVELQETLTKAGVRSVILKGQGIALLHKFREENLEHSLGMLRQSGDIDVWADISRKKVIDLVMTTAPTREFDQKHIHFHVFDDVEVEMHWIPVNRNSPKFNRVLGDYFGKERKRQFTHCCENVCYPTIDFQLVHQLLHVYGHYVYEGVGLRQMMDLYFAQIAVKERMPEKAEEVLGIFKRLGLLKFVAGTQYVLEDVFGMKEDSLLCTPDTKEGRQLLEEIEKGGNFGQYDKENWVKNETFVHRALRRYKRKWRMVRFDPLGTVLMPFSRVYLEIWMRNVRRKYGVE